MNVSDNTVSTPDAKIPLQPMKPTDILDAMFSLYLRHLRLFLGISAVYFVTMFSLSLLSLTGIFYTFSGTLSGTFAIMVVLFVIAVPVVVIVSLLVTGGLTFASAQCYLGEQTTFRDALQHVLYRFLPYLGSSFLWGLVVGALMITIIGIPFAIYFAVLWSFYSVAVLVEGQSVMHSFRRSKELVKGTWWRVFGILLAIYLLNFHD